MIKNGQKELEIRLAEIPKLKGITLRNRGNQNPFSFSQKNLLPPSGQHHNDYNKQRKINNNYYPSLYIKDSFPRSLIAKNHSITPSEQRKMIRLLLLNKGANHNRESEISIDNGIDNDFIIQYSRSPLMKKSDKEEKEIEKRSTIVNKSDEAGEEKETQTKKSALISFNTKKKRYLNEYRAGIFKKIKNIENKQSQVIEDIIRCIIEFKAQMINNTPEKSIKQTINLREAMSNSLQIKSKGNNTVNRNDGSKRNTVNQLPLIKNTQKIEINSVF